MKIYFYVRWEESVSMEINELFQLTADKGASDLLLTAGSPPMLRVNGSFIIYRMAEGREEIWVWPGEMRKISCIIRRPFAADWPR